MSETKLQYPSKRILPSGTENIGNPLYITDIIHLHDTINNLSAILFNRETFVIISGLEPDGANFTAGYFYFNDGNGNLGVFYTPAVTNGKYLQVAYTGVQSKVFNDGTPRNIYNQWTATQVNAPNGTLTTPQFVTGTMEVYRKNLTNLLTKTNTTSYTPTADYHPATKKYADNLNTTYKVKIYTGDNTSTSSYGYYWTVTLDGDPALTTDKIISVVATFDSGIKYIAPFKVKDAYEIYVYNFMEYNNSKTLANIKVYYLS